MNKLSLSIKFYLLKNREKSGMLPLYCRININRKKSEFSMNEWVDPRKWSEEGQTVKGSPELSAKIKAVYLELKGIRDQIIEGGRMPTSKEVKDKFLRKDELSSDLIEYLNSYIDQMVEIGDRSNSTLKKYTTVIKHLTEFLEFKKLSNVTLKGFTAINAREFELYLRTTTKLSNNTAVKYLKTIKTIFNRAIEFGLLNKNPLDNFKFKYETTNREFLTQDELNSIIELEVDNDSLKRVKDLFLFSCYSGLRFADVSRLELKSIVKDSSDNEWIQLEMEKTKDFHRIPLLDKAKEILERHKIEAEITGKLLPVRSNQKVNTYLKVIADLCGIDKHLTYHMARHTFATTVTLSNDIPVEIVSKMLGHKNLATTKIYAKITNQYMQGYADKLNKKL
jgi:integrase